VDALLFSAALLCYLAVAGTRLVDPHKPAPWLPRALDVGLGLGLLTHLGGLVAMWVASSEPPIRAAGGSVAIIAMVIGVGGFFVRPRDGQGVLAGVHVALVAVLLGISLLLPRAVSHEATPALATVWMPVHALSLFVGISSFALGFGVSIVYLWVRKRLKSKQLVGLDRLPSLDSLDMLNTRCVVVGFLALTLGIAAGGLWAITKESPPEGLGEAVWATLIAWGWYAAAVLVRVVGGWRGRLAAHFSVMGFIGMLVSLGGILILNQGWHG
jgi:ABC-type transport system involved in cytochrome c biogenesis permease subunit